MIAESHPILSGEETKRLEAALFQGDADREWGAMQRAGAAVGRAVVQDGEEIGGWPASTRMLVLVGKGHNGGDALIAAETVLNRLGDASAEIVFVFGERGLKPLAARAWRSLCHRHGRRVATVSSDRVTGRYELCLDGIFGFQFRPPVDERVAEFIARVNSLPMAFRAAVDLPSAGVFRADFTYATGVVKQATFDSENTGRLRYLDLGFFSGDEPGAERVLTDDVLEPLRRFRSSRSDKRSFGHLFVMASSRSYPGAALMTVRAALRSGVGLLTAFVPESLVPAYAAVVPEAIWVGCPETPDGGLALEGLHLLRDRVDRATAWVIGPGLSRESETQALAIEILKNSTVPVLLDADALQPQFIAAAKSALVLTPHAGEFERIAGAASLRDYIVAQQRVVVLKGPFTRIAGPQGHERVTPDSPIYHSFFGGPVLARGGSGDVLAGLIGGLLAQQPDDPLLAAARGAVWHGLAADALARAHGQVAVNTTQLLDFLPVALRGVTN